MDSLLDEKHAYKRYYRVKLILIDDTETAFV